MKMNKNWSLLVTFATVASMLAACTPGGGGSSPAASTPAPGGASATTTTPAASNQKVELRMTWWGSQVRHDATLKVIELFEKKNPTIKINGEYLGSDGYWDKLNTQIAGGNAPDLIQLGNNYPDYVARNALLDINPYLGKEINVADFDKATVESGAMDGKLYGINLGSNAFGIAYNTELIKKSGLQPPTGNWTWDEFGKYAQDLTKALGKGFYGAVDESKVPLYLNYMARQSNKTLYKDGKVGLGKEEIAKWFTTWDNYRKQGSTPPAEITTAYTENPDNSTFVEGKTVMHLIWSNQVNAYQKSMKDEINIVLPPNGGAGAAQGLWLQPSQFMSVNAKTKNPKEAAMFISFMVNDPEATMILGSERGVPGSSKVREALKAQATPVDKKVYDYIDLAAKNSRVLDREIPNGKEFETTIVNLSQKILFGKETVPNAAQELLNAAEKVIKK
ncbi:MULTISPECIES: ABC transporter substrate-binding protein [Paenibacillus]|uniref:Sugar ABC transporter substrate-binding protein n=1 Tax=Paenibacillus radicis (ex Xue et al. 2023) TaxID=2972489 RepID=A0ABT1YBG2_9BACL|nr:sugar ABC transporter substrate-binding protein [Paenibacillus radicis (ex Xue et al. 2023)]MCR8630527.1 sugar ABC transporter substrate-binding protein [Paenibacillus radicis (ex Xue et al. 2023)]